MSEQRRPAPYHHGDLRAALLAVAAEEIEVGGTARLSLRALARRAGVSHAAPAHHFGNKRGLFTALAAEGFAMLHRRTSAVLGRDDALVVAGQRYVAFALEHPAHFQVMWDQSLVDTEDEELTRHRATTFEVLYEAVRGATGAADEAQVVAQGVAAWAVVHGIATLWLSGNLPYERDPRLVERAFRDLAPALVPVARVSLAQLNASAAPTPPTRAPRATRRAVRTRRPRT
jgi:AcrR family transcriptional regulator